LNESFDSNDDEQAINKHADITSFPTVFNPKNVPFECIIVIEKEMERLVVFVLFILLVYIE
jgi:hypothetical protein